MRLASVGAVAAGFAATFVLSVGGDVVMHVTGVFPPMDVPMSGALFAWALTYRVVASVGGGYVTARLAPERPWVHAQALMAVGTVAGCLGVVAWFAGGPAMGPLWYPVAIVLTAPPAIGLGARLV